MARKGGSAKRRTKVDVSSYERKRGNQWEHVRDYSQDRMMRGPPEPAFSALRRDTPPGVRPTKNIAYPNGRVIDIWVQMFASRQGWRQETGDRDEFGWDAIAVDLDPDSIDEIAHQEPSENALTQDERDFIRRNPWAIIFWHNGWHYLNYYPSEGERNRKFDELNKAYEDGLVGDEIDF